MLSGAFTVYCKSLFTLLQAFLPFVVCSRAANDAQCTHSFDGVIGAAGRSDYGGQKDQGMEKRRGGFFNLSAVDFFFKLQA